LHGPGCRGGACWGVVGLGAPPGWRHLCFRPGYRTSGGLWPWRYRGEEAGPVPPWLGLTGPLSKRGGQIDHNDARLLTFVLPASTSADDVVAHGEVRPMT